MTEPVATGNGPGGLDAATQTRKPLLHVAPEDLSNSDSVAAVAKPNWPERCVTVSTTTQQSTHGTSSSAKKNMKPKRRNI